MGTESKEPPSPSEASGKLSPQVKAPELAGSSVYTATNACIISLWHQTLH